MLRERQKARERVLEASQRLAGELRKRLGRITLIVYGSYARGDFHEHSDVDIIIVSEAFEEAGFLDRYDLFQDLLPPGFEAKPYTPKEYEEMLRDQSWRKALGEAVVVVDDYGLFSGNTVEE